jgi:hypothetical protein
VHGRSAPQVRFAAELQHRQIVLVDAIDAWQAARGTRCESSKLGCMMAAKRSLERFEAKLAELSALRRSLRQKERGPGVRSERRRPARPRIAAATAGPADMSRAAGHLGANSACSGPRCHYPPAMILGIVALAASVISTGLSGWAIKCVRQSAASAAITAGPTPTGVTQN